MNKLVNTIKSKIDYPFNEIFKYFIFASLLLIFLDLQAQQLLISVSVLFILSAIIALQLSRKRKMELKLIEETIRNMNIDFYDSPKELVLGSKLSKIEDELKSLLNDKKKYSLKFKKIEKNRAEFLGNVSHELRTPIFAIQGFLETLLAGAINDPNVNIKFLEKANKHTLNLNELLNDLIDISMIESGQMELHYSYFSLNDFIVEVIQDLIPIANGKNLKLNYLSDNKKTKIFGDKLRLKQVLNNLVSNAIKYTDSGDVFIETNDKKEIVTIKIRDTGIGISKKEIKRIFERFYRGKKTRSGKESGTGLGLAIVKHILEAHNSQIKVLSKLGVGSEFIFTLKK